MEVITMKKNDFGKRLAWLRICLRNSSARNMSLSIGQNAGYINNIENGRNLPSMNIFYNICDFLDITPAEFFDERVLDPHLQNQIYSCLFFLDYAELEFLACFLDEIVKKRR